jgi:solute:Na+ symporter, SSS family
LSARSFFTAERALSWRQVGVSLFATNLSSIALVGLAGGGYQSGIAVFNYEWMAALILVAFASFFLPSFYANGLNTTSAQLGRRYDRRIGVMLSLVTVVLAVAVELAGALYAGARVLGLVLPHMPFALLIAVLGAASALLAMGDGLKLIVKAQVAQFILLLAASAVVSGAAFLAAGGVHGAFEGLSPERMSLIRPASDPVVPWTGLLLGVPVLGFYFWCSNQVMVQRVLAARTLDDARLGCVLAGALKLLVLFLLIMPGVWAAKIFPDLASADDAYAALVLRLLPPPLIALVMTALLGATLTAAASNLNAVSTLIVFDFVKPLRKTAEGEGLVLAGRIAILAVTAVVVLWTPQITRFPSLWNYLQGVLAYVTPPFVALFIVSQMWSAATARGGFWGLIAGLSFGAALLAAQGLGLVALHFLVAAFAIFVVSGLTLVLVSGAGARDDDGARRARLSPAGRSGLAYRIAAPLLLATTAVVVWVFR